MRLGEAVKPPLHNAADHAASLREAALALDASLTAAELERVANRVLTAFKTWNDLAGAIEMDAAVPQQCRRPLARLGSMIFLALQAAFMRERLWHEIERVYAERH